MKSFVPSYLRSLHIDGPDAVAFIQSQVTLNLESTQAGHFYPAAWCDAKGRTLFILLIACRQDHVMAVLPESQIDAVVGRLKMFSIGRKVRISTAQPVKAWIQDHGSSMTPEQDRFPLIYDPQRAIRMRSTADQDATEKRQAEPELDQQWQAADLAYGFPWLTSATSGRFIPQMLGLEALEGLSYDKGCYPGQEVIARVHYRGKVVRKTIGFEIVGQYTIKPADEFDIAGGKGVILYTLSNPERRESDRDEPRMRGLAVVPATVEAGQTFEWNHAAGTIVTLGHPARMHLQ